MNRIKDNILATLAYFDLFEYPLTGNEIYLFIKERVVQSDLDFALKYLVAGQSVYQFGNFYTLRNDYQLIIRRYKGNNVAAGLIKTATQLAKVLIYFPFVRGIAISGSLSKKHANENSAIPFFIITAKNRLWIARTLMQVFKKLAFCVNRQSNFCISYMIDDGTLEIKEKNFYTAVELLTLIPLQGDTVLEQFYAANCWTRDYLPNKVMRLSSAKPVRSGFFKLMIEQLFNSPIGNTIDNLLMKITAKRWHKKPQLNSTNTKHSIIAMAAAKHYAKPDPRHFQARLLAQYASKISKMHIMPQNLLAN